MKQLEGGHLPPSYGAPWTIKEALAMPSIHEHYIANNKVW